MRLLRRWRLARRGLLGLGLPAGRPPLLADTQDGALRDHAAGVEELKVRSDKHVEVVEPLGELGRVLLRLVDLVVDKTLLERLHLLREGVKVDQLALALERVGGRGQLLRRAPVGLRGGGLGAERGDVLVDPRVAVADLDVVAAKERLLEQEAEPWRLGHVDARRPERLGDERLGRRGAPDQHQEADHLADLVQHERLAVELDRDPLGAVDDLRLRDAQPLHVPVRAPVAELFPERVVVEVVRARVLGKDAPHPLEDLGRDAPLPLCLHVLRKLGRVAVLAPEGVVQHRVLAHRGVVPRRQRCVRLALGAVQPAQHAPHAAVRLGRDEHVGRQQVLVHARVAAGARVERVLHAAQAPDAHLLGEQRVDVLGERLPLGQRRRLEDQLEREQVARRVHAAVGARGALQLHLVRVHRVVRTHGARAAEGVEDVALDRLYARVHLEPRVAGAAVAKEDGHLALGEPLARRILSRVRARRLGVGGAHSGLLGRALHRAVALPAVHRC